MALYTMGDLHLSFSTEKPMTVFEGWENYTERISANWNRIVQEEDTVILPGDFSWAMTLEETYNDFAFLESLNGKKILLKGNHDYWWTTMKRITAFLDANGFSARTSLLLNNSAVVEGKAIVGTRGWFQEGGDEHGKKIIARECLRLGLSRDSVPADFDGEIITFLHYPPIYSNYRIDEMLWAVKKTGCRRCFYGHVHGKSIPFAFNGEEDGITYRLVSADALGFTPYRIV